MPKNGKRALVTGGAGLIGSHVADLLVSEGWKVRVLEQLICNQQVVGSNPTAGSSARAAITISARDLAKDCAPVRAA
jgi:dTDP-L-rhamnose 4-epimerase